MSTEEIATAIILTVVVYGVLQYNIFRWSIHAENKKLREHLEIQSKLLMEIARKNGVQPAELEKTEEKRKSISSL